MNRSSQIATILTLIIAAIFLFIVITINIGRVSQKKTIIDNACDAAGLLLASSLGSVGSSLKHELELWGSDTESCTPNWTLIIGIIVLIAGIAGAIFSGGSTLVLALGILGAIAGAATIAGDVLYAAYTEPGLMREMQAKFQNMTAEQRIFEVTIQSALFTTIDDPAFVPDLFDADRDGLKSPGTLDKIPQFNHWYFQRLNSLPRIGELVEEFYRYLFRDPPQFEVIEDPESWEAEEAYLLVNGSWRIADWLRDTFKPFITTLYTYGYGVSFASDYTEADISQEEDDLGELYRHIREFEEFIKGIYGASKDELIAGFEGWYSQFYNDSESDDWWDEIGEWIEHISDWIVELDQRHYQIRGCVSDCCYYEWDCCGGGGPCCRQDCDEYSCWCVQTMGCCGAWRCCCELCGDPHCPPPVTCSTPTGGNRNCCDSACHLRVGCDDTVIPPYLTRLEEFRNSLVAFRNTIVDIYNRSEAQKNNPWTYKAIYAWKDVVLSEFGSTVPQGEHPAHMVYVKLDIPSDFKFPYITQRREWHWLVVPMICKSVEGATGEFDITVARYDEDIAKRGPLANFWRFKFRRAPRGEEVADLNDLRGVADTFYNMLNGGQSCSLDNLISPEEAERLGNFAFNNGIAAKVRVHYGPGETQEDQASVPANRRNQDIYIVRRDR